MTERLLPNGCHVFERGWLSSNNVLFVDDRQSVLVDSGYCTHSKQTLNLVTSVLGDRPLDQLLNTHLHSDHCGGNAALQSHFAALLTGIPPGCAAEVDTWNEAALTFAATGQSCPRFVYQHTLKPGTSVTLGGAEWEIHSASGHDLHAILLFCPEHALMISADALWEDGFGVVFPELEGEPGFDDVGETLDLIERLQPKTVIPGHGRIFHGVAKALLTARKRLDYFSTQPDKHYLYAAKVLMKFKLLELQRCTMDVLSQWAVQTPYVSNLQKHLFPELNAAEITRRLVEMLVKSGAAKLDDNTICNVD